MTGFKGRFLCLTTFAPREEVAQTRTLPSTAGCVGKSEAWGAKQLRSWRLCLSLCLSVRIGVCRSVCLCPGARVSSWAMCGKRVWAGKIQVEVGEGSQRTERVWVSAPVQIREYVTALLVLLGCWAAGLQRHYCGLVIGAVQERGRALVGCPCVCVWSRAYAVACVWARAQMLWHPCAHVRHRSSTADFIHPTAPLSNLSPLGQEIIAHWQFYILYSIYTE